MNSIRKQDLNTLNTQDIYSLMMFILYKFKDIPEYSSISELAFILDKNNLLKLCEYFGGQTITIPTIQELEMVLDALLLYEYINIEKLEYEDAINKIKCDTLDLRQIKSAYKEISEVLERYNIG